MAESDLRDLKRLFEPIKPWWQTPSGCSEDFLLWMLSQE